MQSLRSGMVVVGIDSPSQDIVVGVVLVTAVARATAAPANTIDQIVAEVEVAMLGTQDALLLGGLAVDVMLVALDEPRISGEGDKIVASVDMQFQVLVNAREGIPDAVI